MHVFIDFWKLETENNVLHVFSFLHKLNFENSFCFLSILNCQTSFLVLKIKKNCFWKQKIMGKNSYQTYPKTFTILIFIQVYSNNLWVNFGIQELRILKNSKLESCRYLSQDSNPSGFESIGVLRKEIRTKYWSVLKSDFSFSDSAFLIFFLIWSFQSW